MCEFWEVSGVWRLAGGGAGQVTMGAKRLLDGLSVEKKDRVTNSDFSSLG